MNHYKKLNPSQPVYLSNGTHVKFQTLDNITGYVQTNNQFVIDEFAKAIKAQRGGIIPIEPEEFEENFTKKKQMNPDEQPRPLEREHLKPSQIASDTGSQTTPIAPKAAEPVGPAVGLNIPSDVPKRDGPRPIPQPLNHSDSPSVPLTTIPPIPPSESLPLSAPSQKAPLPEPTAAELARVEPAPPPRTRRMRDLPAAPSLDDLPVAGNENAQDNIRSTEVGT